MKSTAANAKTRRTSIPHLDLLPSHCSVENRSLSRPLPRGFVQGYRRETRATNAENYAYVQCAVSALTAQTAEVRIQKSEDRRTATAQPARVAYPGAKRGVGREATRGPDG